MTWLEFGGLTLLLYLLYTLIPSLLLHHWGIGSFRGHLGPGVVLSFDDGPNPECTLRLLDLLDHHGVKAVFFLVGQRAQAHPELVLAIRDRGHQIGLHGQVHFHAWLMGPWKTWRCWSEGRRNLEAITGQPVQWIRPPWGTFNLVIFIWARFNGLRSILWTAQGKDWRETDPDRIIGRILSRIDEGDIIVLHDAGPHPEAPEYMLRALDQLITRIIQDKKIPIVALTLPQVSIGRQTALRLWAAWEGLYARHEKIQRIGLENIYRINRTTYDGPPLISDSGAVLAKSGDAVAELHLDSIRMQTGETEPARIAVASLRKARASLPELAAFISQSPDFEDIQVLVSVTLINRGLKGLGFQVAELPDSLKNRRIGLIQRTILRIYHPEGKLQRMGRPKLVWISRQELLRRWLVQDPAAHDQAKDEAGTDRPLEEGTKQSIETSIIQERPTEESK